MLDDRDYMRTPGRFDAQWSVTLLIIVLNVLVFIGQNVVDYLQAFPIYEYLALSINGLKHGYIWQLITFQFLHSGIFHILGNLLGIYFFGYAVEEAIGKSSFVKLYLLSGVVGGILQMAFGLAWPDRFGTAVVGASAGGFGLMAAFATLFPHRPLYMFFLPFEVRARVLLWFGIVISVIGMAMRPRPGEVHIAACAHLGGVLCGLAYVRWLTHAQKPLVVWQPFRPKGQRRELAKVRSQRPQAWQQPKTRNLDDLPSSEFISKQVDPILDKISAHGIQSLTDRERQILEAARAKMARR